MSLLENVVVKQFTRQTLHATNAQRLSEKPYKIENIQVTVMQSTGKRNRQVTCNFNYWTNSTYT